MTKKEPDIPGYETMYQACLKALGDLGGTAHSRAIVDKTAEILCLSKEQQIRIVISHADSQQPAYVNKLGLTLWGLQTVGYITQAEPGLYALTVAGRNNQLSNKEIDDLLAQNLAKQTPEDNRSEHRPQATDVQDKAVNLGAREVKASLMTQGGISQATELFDTHGIDTSLKAVTDNNILEAAGVFLMGFFEGLFDF